MPTLNKLEYLDETKSQIKTALNQFGAGIQDTDTFRSYVSKISNIYTNWAKVTGENTLLSLTPTKKGLMELNLRGNTSQASTPTPDTPQPIHSVSGDNTITIAGKNLLPNELANATTNGMTATKNSDGSITLNGTTTSATDFVIYRDLTLQSGTYTLSGCPSGGGSNTYRLALFLSGATKSDTGTGITFTLSEATTYNAMIRLGSGVTFNNAKFYPMVENSSTATSYEPYTGDTYPINLPSGMELNSIGDYKDTFKLSDGSQLFDKDNAHYINGSFSGSSIVAGNNDRIIYIPCKENTTYTLSKAVQNTSSYNRLNLATTTDIPTIGSTINDKVLTSANNSNPNLSITTSAGAKYIVAFIYTSNNELTFEDMLKSIMIVESSTALAWQPYGVGKWYLEKNTNSIVLDGSENWTIQATGTENYYYQSGNIINSGNNNNARASSKCNLYSYASIFSSNTNQGFWLSDYLMRIRYGAEDTLANFTAMLNEKKPVIKYPLATPQGIEITDTTLISQLNAIKNAMSYNGQTNISQVNNDLPFIISASALMKGGN